MRIASDMGLNRFGMGIAQLLTFWCYFAVGLLLCDASSRADFASCHTVGHIRVMIWMSFIVFKQSA